MENHGNKHMLFWIALVLFLSVAVRSQGTSSASGWHERDAEIRFRVEKDYTHSLIPNISLLDVPPDKESASVAKWIEEKRWTEKRRVNGKLALNFLPSQSKPATYNLHRDFTHFVARASLIDGADPNSSIRFEIHTDRRPLFRSPPLTVQNPVVEINVAMPPQSKQIKLSTNSRDSKYRGWAKWVDPGFMVRRQYPKVSFTRIYAPGYNLEDFVPEVYATSDGARVDSRILSVGRGEPMDILFDSSAGHPSYLIYLVPKSKHKKPASSWQPQAGLVLETKWTKNRFGKSDGLPEFSKAFKSIVEPVGRSLVDDIQHVFPIHRMPEHDAGKPPTSGGYGLYHYEGFFPIYKGGKCSFATVSNWDSYLTVDDKLVVAWPGQHGTGGGTRGEKQGTVSLTPGIHKLEYFNYSPWGKMYCLAAWKKPGEKLRPMTMTDFVPFGRYRPASAGFSESSKTYMPFEWSAVDEFRVEQTGRCFVTMRFEALAPPGSDYSYLWTFGDGTIATGETVDHVFLRPALHRVRLEARSQETLVAQAAHDVYVRGRWDKTLQNLNNADSYDHVIKTRNLAKAPADDLVNLYVLAEQAYRPDWKKRATAALAGNVTRLVRESEDTSFILSFGQHLHSAELKEYDKALELFTRLAGKSGLGKSVTATATIRRAEVLVNYFGRYEDALKALGNQGAGDSSGSDVARRAVLTRAQAMLGLGQTKGATELIQKFAGSAAASDKVRQQIKHSGLVRRARLLAETQNDPNQWDNAMTMIETIVAEAPAKTFAPNVNLVKLDIYLARKEFAAAMHLTERLRHLQLNDYDRAEVLARQVIASCGLKDMDKARSVYAQLSKDYAYSPALAEAKKAIMQTFGRQ
ncbi:MAG: PKD domain-containing protein [Phycisphaerae bacterium]|nr:PKD domain-containing protein [Phycisphaerae bacterium]